MNVRCHINSIKGVFNKPVVLTLDYYNDISVPKETLDGIVHTGLEVAIAKELDALSKNSDDADDIRYRFSPEVRFYGRRYLFAEEVRSFKGDDLSLAAVSRLSASCGVSVCENSPFRMVSRMDGRLLRRIRRFARQFLMTPSGMVPTVDLRIALDAMRNFSAPFFMDCRKDPSGYYIDDPDLFSEIFRYGLCSRLHALVGTFGKEGRLTLPYPAAISVNNVVLSVSRQPENSHFGLNIVVTNGAVEVEMPLTGIIDSELARLYLNMEPMFVNEHSRYHWEMPWRLEI